MLNEKFMLEIESHLFLQQYLCLHFIVHVVCCYKCEAYIINYCCGNEHHKQLPLSDFIPAFSKTLQSSILFCLGLNHAEMTFEV